MAVDSATVGDFNTMLRQAHGEFQAECVAKARPYRRYFATRDRLKSTITSIRNAVPAETKAAPVPSGVNASAWKKLIDGLAAAEKLLREEEKKVAANVPTPPPVKAPKTSGPKSKQYYRRQESRRKLKKLLKEIYGNQKGALRYKVYEKMAKEAGQSKGSPGAMWAFFNGQDVEERIAQRATQRAAGGAADEAAAAAAAAATDAGLAPVDPAAAAQVAPAGGIAAVLWPTDKPIYARPAAIVGVVAVVGVVGFLLLGTPKKPAAPVAAPLAK